MNATTTVLVGVCLTPPVNAELEVGLDFLLAQFEFVEGTACREDTISDNLLHERTTSYQSSLEACSRRPFPNYLNQTVS